jgi:hypothetical protein
LGISVMSLVTLKLGECLLKLWWLPVAPHSTQHLVGFGIMIHYPLMSEMYHNFLRLRGSRRFVR